MRRWEKVQLNVYLLVHHAVLSKSEVKSFRKNGGDDGTRTRGLCRDSGPVIGFSMTYKTAGTAKGRLSR